MASGIIMVTAFAVTLSPVTASHALAGWPVGSRGKAACRVALRSVGSNFLIPRAALLATSQHSVLSRTLAARCHASRFNRNNKLLIL